LAGSNLSLQDFWAGFLATDVSLVAWLAQNYKTADTVLLVLSSIGIVLVTLIVIVVNRVAFRRMAKLEDL
jgi:uncharacterized membrane protein YcjF (UPF0283 family)